MEKDWDSIMFDDIGKKIQRVAKGIAWFSIVLSIVAGIFLFLYGLSDFEYNWYMVLLAPLVIFFGCIGAWLSVIILYGFGKIVDDLTALRNHQCPETNSQNNSTPGYVTYASSEVARPENIGNNEVAPSATANTNVQQTSPLANANFKIVNNVLKKYRGKYPNVFIPNGVSTIGSSSFEFCESIKKVNVSDGVTVIEPYAFNGCKKLIEINLPETLTAIGAGAFAGCHTLTKLIIPDSVTTINSGAFQHCSNLESITLPNSIPSINDYLFFGCEKLESIVIPETVTSIGTCAFTGCEKLKSITIPKSVKNIMLTALPLNKDLTIYTPAGSVAEDIALQKRINVVHI